MIIVIMTITITITIIMFDMYPLYFLRLTILTWPTRARHTSRHLACLRNASAARSCNFKTFFNLLLLTENIVLGERMIFHELFTFIKRNTHYISWRHAGAYFTNDSLLAIQIRWKPRLAVIPLLASNRNNFFHMSRPHRYRAMYKIWWRSLC